jgi:O-antigen/teichoic acid export membrane protein
MNKGSIKINAITNYAAAAWIGFLTIILTPIYFNKLETSQWGIVSICLTIQSFLSILDAGLGQIMQREVARNDIDPIEDTKIFKLFSSTYLFIGVSACILGQISTTWLATKWFNNGNGMGENGEIAIRMAFTIFLFQFSNNANIGYWSGKQIQWNSNLRNCLFGTLKHIGAISVIYTVKNDAVGYLTPFLIVSCIEYIANRSTINKALKNEKKVSLTKKDYYCLAKKTASLAVAVILGVLASQADKIILSRTIDTRTFGQYVLIVNLGLAFMQLQYPLMRAFAPSITISIKNNNDPKLIPLTRAIIIFCIAPCTIAGVFSTEILNIWTKDFTLAEIGSPLLRLILISVSLNALYNIIYQCMVARNESIIISKINLLTVILSSTILIQMSGIYKMMAGGISWLTISIIQIGFGVYWFRKQMCTHKY